MRKPRLPGQVQDCSGSIFAGFYDRQPRRSIRRTTTDGSLVSGRYLRLRGLLNELSKLERAAASNDRQRSAAAI